MADSGGWATTQQSSHSAVVDLEDAEMEIIDNDASDYESHFEERRDVGRKRREGPSYMEDAGKKFGANVTEAVFEAGKQQAKRAWSVYGNIDILRPFFDVEPQEVSKRLLLSLVPKLPSAQRQRVPRELYGPLMVIFTMIALLLFQMKTSGHKVEEGTLMGTAFGVCFTYWLGASTFIWFLCYVCNTHMAFVQILSMVGYALFGHCLVLFLGTIIHTSHDHLFFYILWAIVGGLSSLRMASLVISRTSGQTQRLIVCGVLAVLHLLFLLYLHFAYHQIVEEISEAFQDFKKPHPDISLEEASHQLKERAIEGIDNIKNALPDAAGKAVDENLQKAGETVVESVKAGDAIKSVQSDVRKAMAPVAGLSNGTVLHVDGSSKNASLPKFGEVLVA
ncbi:protein YIPF3-like [Liolophura sinensis]|uniref:protein YIPF3-like n=1 Tax=Liolophura sinensis TaxID=3198878 RepID=UPI0031582498